MSSGLKGYIPSLARLGPSRARPRSTSGSARWCAPACWLRESGRGPGSGVRTTAGSVALLLISVMATESLSEAADRTREIAEARPNGGRRCPLTRMTNFKDALAAILVQKALSRKPTEIVVSRTQQKAVIKFHQGESVFLGTAAKDLGIRVEATLDQNTLRRIADDVSEIVVSDEGVT